MTDQSGAPTDSSSTSGIQYIKFAASGRNRFVTWIALHAALGGFLFGRSPVLQSTAGESPGEAPEGSDNARDAHGAGARP